MTTQMGYSNPQKKTSLGVSVILCCSNESLHLIEAIEQLAQQNIPENLPWEIILIGNVKDAPFADIWEQHKIPNVSFKTVHEAKTELSYLRKSGAKEATYEYLIFCSDTIWLHKDYVFLATQTLENSKEIGACGGQIIPTTDAKEFPQWFEAYKEKYAVGTPASNAGDISYKGFLATAGIATRKSLFLQLNNDIYASLLPIDTSETHADNMFEYCRRLLLLGYKLYYHDGLKLTKFVPKEHLSIACREKLMDNIIHIGEMLYEYDTAIQTLSKTRYKNRVRLVLLSPFRIFFASMGWSKRSVTEEKLKLFYLSPFSTKTSTTKGLIKKILYKQ